MHKRLNGTLARTPPSFQCFCSRVWTQRSLLKSEFQQELVRLADLTARPDAQNVHDLVAVEVGPDGVELFLFGKDGNAFLELVVGALQGRRLALISRRAVGPGQDVQ